MRSRILPIALLVVIIIGIIFGILYYQSQSPIDPTNQTPTEEVSPLAPDATVSPDPNAAASPMVAPSSNPSPDLTVDAAGLSKATVVMNTTQGQVRYKFYPNDAPNTVKRIIELVNQGFYNGLSFHRVVPGFVVQGGDPQGNGTGGSGQRLKAEFNERRHVEGAVAMARAADPDSADSQFYITLSPQPHLDRSYTVFGQVIEGMDVVRRLQVGDKITTMHIE